ncbi:hypothetical protein [Pseudonocardia sp. Ae707_Ps2]|uniref:hypothetical protein n=1 Tax=Pseudonocardia sp. Ae707_Ps2 TaxID=2212992 RepID=UPI00307DC3E1
MTTEKIVATLQLPDHFQGTAEQKKAVTAAPANAGCRSRWRLAGARPSTRSRSTSCGSPQCRGWCRSRRVRDKVEACKPGEILIGLDRAAQAVPRELPRR